MNLGLNRKSRKKHDDAQPTGEYIDPAEQVRRSINKSVDIGSPLLYPF